jgi:hypothetical protein
MTASNRLQLAAVREQTYGTTPNTPRMRKMRVTGEGLIFRPDFVMSDEIRDDRMTSDPIKVGETNQGPINFELHYPVPGSVLAEAFASALCAEWTDTPTRDNDGTADSVITDIGTTANTIAFTTGSAFVVGHLVRNSGFAVAGNNGLFPVTTGGATSLVSTGASFTAETAPPGAARVKVVGFQGTSGDITATATGLASTTLNFTTLGLAPGQWIKIGGTGSAFRFADEALNTWARVSGTPMATALPLDNLPAGWATNAGTGKTIRVFFGDRIRNGVSKIGLTVERGFLGQAVPTYVSQTGMRVASLSLSLAAKQKLTGSFEFMGLTGAQSTTSLDASPDEAPDNAAYQVLAGSANVGRIAEAGATLSAPNWARSLSLSLTNNLRMIEAVDTLGAVDITDGECTVTAQLETYFGSNALYAKMLAGTATSVNARATKDSRALVIGLPRLTITDGNPNASAKNQDVMLPLSLSASKDTLTNAHILLDRIEYYEA